MTSRKSGLPSRKTKPAVPTAAKRTGSKHTICLTGLTADLTIERTFSASASGATVELKAKGCVTIERATFSQS